MRYYFVCLGLACILAERVALAADPAGVLLGKYQWDAALEVWEPAANPAIQVAGQTVTRAKHRWATLTGKVRFECRLIGDAVWAVNPVPEEDRPKLTPHSWDSAALLNMLGGPLGDVEITNGKVQQAQLEITPIYRRPACFGLRWRARFEKGGAVFSYTPPVDNPVNPLSPNPFTVQLDGDMDDQLTGLTEICCCAWNLGDPIAEPTEEIAAEPTVSAKVDTGEEEPDAEVFASRYGVDWIAVPTRSPDPQSWGDAQTVWQGSYELKSCTYEHVQVINADGTTTGKRRKTRDYEPDNEANDADDTAISQ